MNTATLTANVCTTVTVYSLQVARNLTLLYVKQLLNLEVSRQYTRAAHNKYKFIMSQFLVTGSKGPQLSQGSAAADLR